MTTAGFPWELYGALLCVALVAWIAAEALHAYHRLTKGNGYENQGLDRVHSCATCLGGMSDGPPWLETGDGSGQMEMTCPVCGTVTPRRFRPDMTERIRPVFGGCVVQCTRCGLGRIDPMPTFDALHTYYEYGQFAEDQNHDYVSKRAAPHLLARLDELESWLGRRGRICDIGCGDGSFLWQAKYAHWDTCGTEPHLEGVIAPEHIGVVQSTFHLSGQMDVVHISHVLEHVICPHTALAEAYALLRPNGLLFIEAPCEMFDLLTAARLILGREIECNAVPSPHLWFFSARTLAALLRKAGFTVLSARTVRRNRDTSSRYFGGGLAKRALYAAETALRLGPVVEVVACKSEWLRSWKDK